MKKQAGSSRFDTVLKMLLIAFISLLAFSSGVFFGRVMAENDSRLKALEPGEHQEHTEHASEKHGDFDQHAEEAISAEDVEAISDKYVKAEHGKAGHGEGDVLAETDADSHGRKPSNAAAAPAAHAAVEENSAPKKIERTKKHAAAKAADHDTHAEPAKTRGTEKAHGTESRNVAAANAHKPIVKELEHHDADAELARSAQKKMANAKPDMTAVHEAARRVASNDTPSEAPAKAKKVESRIPSSLPKSVGTATEIEYTVQVASYPSLDEAKGHANDLVKKGFPAYPVEANVKGKMWYRVSVGSFKTQKEAGAYRSQLMKQAELASAIVQKIQR